MQDGRRLDLVTLSADLVADYVSHNSISAYELPTLITQVHGTFVNLVGGSPVQAEEQPVAKPTPAQIRKSITPDALISFIDGKPYKTLKRHLNGHGLGFLAYRQRYDLPADYPAIAPNYSAMRSAMAKENGLGQMRQKTVLEPTPAAKPTRAARKAAKPIQPSIGRQDCPPRP